VGTLDVGVGVWVGEAEGSAVFVVVGKEGVLIGVGVLVISPFEWIKFITTKLRLQSA